MTLSLNLLKHITSINMRMVPVPNSAGTRALRTFLSTIPARLPANAAIVYGLTEMPPIKISSVNDPVKAGIEVSYSDGSKVSILPSRQPTLGFLELQRRVCIIGFFLFFWDHLPFPAPHATTAYNCPPPPPAGPPSIPLHFVGHLFPSMGLMRTWTWNGY